MVIKMELKNADQVNLRYIKSLYKKAFPQVERKPFFFIRKKQKQNLAEILVIEESGESVGFFINAVVRDTVFVDYFAIGEQHRSNGYGSKAIEALKCFHQDKRIVLEIEKVDKKYSDYDTRMRRKNFYLKSGFSETGLFIKLVGIDMEVLSFLGTIDYEEFNDIYRQYVGKTFTKLCLMKL